MGLREVGLRPVEPGRSEASHSERRHDAIRFTEIIPAHAGDFEHREPFRVERQHSMRKVNFFEPLVKIVDCSGFSASTEQGGHADECAIQLRGRAFDDFQQSLHRSDHDETVPETTTQLENLGEHMIRFFPKAPHAKYASLPFQPVGSIQPYSTSGVSGSINATGRTLIGTSPLRRG